MRRSSSSRARGYHGARVSDIAREAGIAYGLVYHYFRNKEEILASVFEERWSRFLAVVETIASGPSTSHEKLEAVAAIILNAFRVRPEWVKVLVLEIQRSSRFSDPERIRAVGRLFEQLARIVRAGQEAGELRRDVDPQVACFVFLGALDLVITEPGARADARSTVATPRRSSTTRAPRGVWWTCSCAAWRGGRNDRGARALEALRRPPGGPGRVVRGGPRRGRRVPRARTAPARRPSCAS